MSSLPWVLQGPFPFPSHFSPFLSFLQLCLYLPHYTIASSWICFLCVILIIPDFQGAKTLFLLTSHLHITLCYDNTSLYFKAIYCVRDMNCPWITKGRALLRVSRYGQLILFSHWSGTYQYIWNGFFWYLSWTSWLYQCYYPWHRLIGNSAFINHCYQIWPWMSGPSLHCWSQSPD